MELVHIAVSENLIPALHPNVKVISPPFDVPFDSQGNFVHLQMPTGMPEDGDFEEASPTAEIVRG